MIIKEEKERPKSVNAHADVAHQNVIKTARNKIENRTQPDAIFIIINFINQSRHRHRHIRHVHYLHRYTCC